MKLQPISTQALGGSVIAVPPLARKADLSLNHAENRRLIQHLEAGGVTTLLYGGNAVLQHLAFSEYAELLNSLKELASTNTIVIPSVGPGFGMMMDQAEILKSFDFPSAMLLPLREGTTPAGIATGFRRLVDRIQRPGVLYLKHDGYMDVKSVKSLFADGVISWIKYAIVRERPQEDPFLNSIIDAIGPAQIVSGMGEQPAILHMRKFGLTGFTSGCVCVAPKLSTRMLQAVKSGNDAIAEDIRKQFAPLESLRDAINPVRVLHAAVQVAGIADVGPITPMLSPVEDSDRTKIVRTVEELCAFEKASV